MNNPIKRLSFLKKSSNTNNTEKKLNISSWENKKFLNNKAIENIWRTFVKSTEKKIRGWRKNNSQGNNHSTIDVILQRLHDIYIVIEYGYNSINDRTTQEFKRNVKLLYESCKNPSKSELSKSEIIAIKKLKDLCEKTLNTFDSAKFKKQKKFKLFTKLNKNNEENWHISGWDATKKEVEILKDECSKPE